MNFPKSCTSVGDCLHYLHTVTERDDWSESDIDELLASIRHHTGRQIERKLCSIGFVWEEDKTLLLLRSPDVSYPGQYDASGGGKEPQDRTPACTAKRETREETGLACGITKKHGTTYAANPAKEEFYSITAFSMEIIPGTSRDIILSSEHTDHGFYEPGEALFHHDKNVMAIVYTVRRWLQRFHDGVVTPR